MALIYRIYGDTADVTGAQLNAATFAIARNATSPVTGLTNASATVGSYTGSGFFNCSQAFLQFDTRSVPASFSSAYLWVNIFTAFSGAGSDYIEAREVTSTTNKIAGDAMAGYGLRGLIVSPTATGRSGINLNSVTPTAAWYLGLWAESERLNVAPTTGTSLVIINMADQTGTTSDPYIEIAPTTYTQVFLTGLSTAVQTTTMPTDWGDASTIEAVGPGGNGFAGTAGTSGSGGGGGAGGMYAAKTSAIGLTAGQTVYYQLGAGVDSWFNDRNLLLQTDNVLTSASWIKTNCTATVSQADPVGGTRASLMTETAVMGQHVVIQAMVRADPAATARSYRWSATVKSATRNIGFCTWLNGSAINAGVGFDLQGTDGGVGTVIGTYTDNAARGTFTDPAITSLGSGWYRISATFNILAGGTDTDFEFQITLHNPGSGLALDYTGSISANATIYGQTLTYGTVDKGYAPTTTAAAYTVLARAGPNATSATGTVAPTALAQGDITFAGGNGGTSGTTRGGGGGGGAAGPTSVGRVGGASSTAATSGGGGGGGGGGASAQVGAATTVATGGAGGGGYAGTGGGAGGTVNVGTAGTAGTGGGGGGGFRATTVLNNSGGAGAMTNQFDATHGPGGGGGGGGGNAVNTTGATTSGGAGALYGGGGGGAGYRRLGTGGAQVGGTGGQGVIVLNYVAVYLGPTGTLAVTLDAMTAAGTGAITTPANPGTLSATLGAMTSSATAKVLVQGQLVMGGGAAGVVVPNIYYRSQSSVAYGTRTSTDFSAPAGIQDGDILLATIFSGRGSSDIDTVYPQPPAGFTLYGTAVMVNAGGFYGKLYLYWKRASGESGGYAFPHLNPANSSNTEGVMKVFGGCIASGSPLGAASINTGLGVTATGTGITTTAANSMLLWEGHNWSAVPSDGPPAGMTRLFDHLVQSQYELISAPGATSNRTNAFNSQGTGDPWTVRMVELLADPVTLYTGSIALRSSSSTTYATRTNTTITAPAGIVDGDILVATMIAFSGSTPPDPTPPSGWAEFGTKTTVADGGYTADLHIYWKRAASESGGYTWTHASVNTQGLIKAYSGGIASGTPLGSTSSNSGAGQFSTGSTLTTTGAQSYLLFEAHDFFGAANLASPSPGMTERFDDLVYSADQPFPFAAGTGTGERPMKNNNIATGLPRWAVRMVELLSAPAVGGSGGFAALTLSATGTAGAAVTSGTLNVTLGAATLAGTGTVQNQIFSGTLSTTLGALTGTLTGKVTVGGTVAATLQPMVVVGTGTVANQVFTGILGSVLAPAVVVGSGTVANQIFSATLSTTLDAMTAAATAKVLVQGQLVMGGAVTAPTTQFLTSYAAPNDRTDFTGEVGLRFTVTSDQVITWLGTKVTTGNTGLHTVNLYHVDSLALLGSASIDVTGKTVGSYVYGPISPFTLTTGTSYGLVKPVTAGADGWGENGATTFASPVSGVVSLYRVPGGGSFVYGTGSYQFVGLDFGTGPTTGGGLDDLTLSGSGSVYTPVAGTVTGTLTATLGDATVAATGTVTAAIFSATLSATLGNVTLAATGKVVISGIVNANLGALTGTLNGKVTVSGIVTAQLQPMMVVATGTAQNQIFSGTLSTTLAPVTLSASGTVSTPTLTTSGTLNVTLGGMTLFASAFRYTAERITEDSIVRITEDGVVRIVETFVRLPGDAWLDATLGPAVLSATGTVSQTVLHATLGVTLGALSGTLSGMVWQRGTLGVTLGALTGTLAGKVTVGAALSSTLAPAALVATGTVKNQVFTGTLSATLAPMTLSATGRARFSGYVKVWNGTDWVMKPAKVWTGSEWVRKLVKHWNGNAWVD